MSRTVAALPAGSASSWLGAFLNDGREACAVVCCGCGTKPFLSAQRITASFAAISRTLAAPLPGAPALVRQRACRARLLCFAEFGAAGRGVGYPGRGTLSTRCAQGTPPIFGKRLDQELFGEAHRRVPGHERGFEILKGRMDWMPKHDLKRL